MSSQGCTISAVGWAHGVLFVVFCVALVQAAVVAKWPAGRGALVFVAALLPFGPFVVDGRMRRYEDEFRRRQSAAG